jgi:hypothetical protein
VLETGITAKTQIDATKTSKMIIDQNQNNKVTQGLTSILPNTL